MRMDADTRFDRARCALEGLSVGDAFGERFFVRPQLAESLIARRKLPAPPWRFTDDTNMTLSLVANLRRHGGIHQEELARSFAERFDGSRGYSPDTHRLLDGIHRGEPWREAAGRLFDGKGSCGNGAAMRVAPLGVYFADDLDAAVEQARRSAEVTHAHPEGAAAAIAVAVAAAWAWRLRETQPLPTAVEFLDLILALVPSGEVYERIRHARNLAPGASVRLAVATLGNGDLVTAQDTVAFTLWCAAQHLTDYAEALWLTVSGLGDRDTTCAIVGGIVASHTGVEGIPTTWRRNREPLPEWPFQQQNLDETITLFRPVSRQELDLLRESGYRTFPTEVPAGPTVYPVLEEESAAQLARDWSARNAAPAYVTRFQVRTAFLRPYPLETMANPRRRVYLIPSEDLAALNRNITGAIEVVGPGLL